MDFWTRIEREWIISHFEAATGVRTESWTVKRSGLEVRMYSREKVELFLLATEDGMGLLALI